MHWVDESINFAISVRFNVLFAMFCPVIHLFGDEYIMYVYKYQSNVNLVIEILFFSKLSKSLLKAVVLTKNDSSEELRLLRRNLL